MDTKSQRPKEGEGVISTLNAAIEDLSLAKKVSSITPARVIFDSVGSLLAMIRDSMVNELDYVELGLHCADICRALDLRVNGKELEELSQSVCGAMDQLAMTVAEIQRKAIKRSKRNVVSRFLHARNDKGMIPAWKVDLTRILRVFNAELGLNTHLIVYDVHRGIVKTHAMVSGTHRDMLKSQKGVEDQHLSIRTSIPGESPPPPPRACFGRGRLIERIITLAEKLIPTALIGIGGIGKTSVALAALHSDRIKRRFGDNRRFIRCDQFPASRAHFLNRLSKAIGAGVENPEDLTPLRPFLSSKEMLIVLDNAESILDPQGADAQEIYPVVEELSRFNNICICITSRVSTTPPDYERLDAPMLSLDAARDTFYRIYDSDDRSDLVNDILEQLDFHPLSITLLANVAHQNKWDIDQLTREWERRQTSALQTEHNKNLSSTIELSLTSPMFQELGPDARALLGVVAFFPQGVDENNLDWLFPTISNRTSVFSTFCDLSLTYRSNGFVTMLAPLREYLSPKDPRLSPLLCTTKDRYFTRLLVDPDPEKPNFGGTRWITSEDVNVEHVLDVFTSIDANSDSVWKACANFATHLAWHKPRLIVLRPKIEGLPDDHRSKPECLFELSRLFESFGNNAGRKQLLTQTLKLQRERGNDRQVTRTLRHLSDINRLMGLHEEGIQLAKEALGVLEQLGDTVTQAKCLNDLARALLTDNQIDAAEEAASRAVNLIPEKGHQSLVCTSHRVLGEIYHSKGEREKAVNHFEVALGIASSLNWHSHLFWIHYSMAKLFYDEGKFDDAHARVEQAKSHTVDHAYLLGSAMVLQAVVWYEQRRLEEARSEALRAIDIFGKLGNVDKMEYCRNLLRNIRKELRS